MINNRKNRKLSYAGHVIRNTSGHYDTLLTTIEGRLDGKRGRGRPRQTWDDDLRDWSGSKRCDQIKRSAERRALHGSFATHSSGCNYEWKVNNVLIFDSPSTLVTSTALSPIRSGSWSMMMVRSPPVLLLIRSIERRCQSVQYMYSPASQMKSIGQYTLLIRMW